MVGRPREFDVDQALDAAMQAFWAGGYEATSLADLMEATGLHKGSLYQAFGDKHNLFILALRRYLEAMRREKNELIAAAPTPLEAVRSVAHAMVEIADGDSACPKGCMAINSLVELVPHDPEVRKIMSDHYRLMLGSMMGVVERGQKTGEIDTTRSPELIARLLMTFMAGLGTTMKGPLSKSDAHRLLDEQLGALL